MRDQNNWVKHLSHKVKNVFLRDDVMYLPDHKTGTVRCTKTVAGKFREKYCTRIWWWIHKCLLNKVAVQCEVYVLHITLVTVTLTFFEQCKILCTLTVLKFLVRFTVFSCSAVCGSSQTLRNDSNKFCDSMFNHTSSCLKIIFLETEIFFVSVVCYPVLHLSL